MKCRVIAINLFLENLKDVNQASKPLIKSKGIGIIIHITIVLSGKTKKDAGKSCHIGILTG